MSTMKNSLLSLFLFISAALVLSACAAPEGSADDGKRWYMMNNCYACHGLHGNDGKAPDIDIGDLSFRKFLAIIRNAKSPIMPRFPEEKVSRQDAADIYAWLRTVQ